MLRLEGPLQSWGLRARWGFRDTAAEPTKSGVIGLLCCALGRRRGEPIDDLRPLVMGVRADRPGEPWVDYHTVGAGIGVLSAEGKIKRTQSTGELEPVVSRRTYLADASFLVALRGEPALVARLAAAIQSPVWPVFLGRKSCPPAVPVFEGLAAFDSIVEALESVPWRPRLAEVDKPPELLRCVLESDPGDPEAELRHDDPVSLAPPRYGPRYVCEAWLLVRQGEPVAEAWRPPSGRAVRYDGPAWKVRREGRLLHDRHLCVFCRCPANPVHHVTYARANEERDGDLRSLCRLCHDAVTLLESEFGLGTERIDPFDPAWAAPIRRTRDALLKGRVVPHRRGRRA
jgi:CRISPR system Cascade subunit CasD